MSSFNTNVYLPITLEPHELNMDLMDHIKNAVITKYLHKETSGFMPKKITIAENAEIPLGELINNQILVYVPCNMECIYYKIGDVVSGVLTIVDESDISVMCGDLICKLRSDSGVISYANSKYCFTKNDKTYANGDEVKVILKEAQAGIDSYFVFLGNIV